MTATRRWPQRVGAAADVARLVVLFNLLAIAKRVLPLRRLARWAAASRRGSERSGSLPTIVGRVLRAGRYAGIPDRDCLQRSLLLFRELSRAGVPAELVVGFRQRDVIEGHAWVTVNGQLVADQAEALATFAPLLRVHTAGSVEVFERVGANP